MLRPCSRKTSGITRLPRLRSRKNWTCSGCFFENDGGTNLRLSQRVVIREALFVLAGIHPVCDDGGRNPCACNDWLTETQARVDRDGPVAVLQVEEGRGAQEREELPGCRAFIERYPLQVRPEILLEHDLLTAP